MGIDFTEIVASNGEGIAQDLWELFAEEFLEMIGYEIISGPSRGPDGGKDIIVYEKITNTGETIKWLVSCKHNAHSGSSVTKKDELDIRDRLEKFDCNGFMGFYSTSPNGSLLRHLEDSKLNKGLLFKIYNSSKISKNIIGNPTFDKLFCRYFPISFKKWKENYMTPEPINLFNYYVKNNNIEFSIKLLLEIFQTDAFLIKSIRNSNDLESLFLEGGVTWIQLENFIDERITIKTDIWEIAKIMFNRAGLEFKNKRMAGMGYSSLDSIFVLTNEYIVVTDKWHVEFKNTYDQLKKIIN